VLIKQVKKNRQKQQNSSATNEIEPSLSNFDDILCRHVVSYCVW